MTIIGILTMKGKKKPFTGNIQLFQQISEKLHAEGYFVLVFTIELWKEHYVEGFQYELQTGKWKKVRSSFPTVIYNRIPSRLYENSPQFQSFLAKTKEIPFFNPCFFEKDHLFELFKRDEALQHNIPVTTAVQTENDVKTMLERFHNVYFKSATGHKGSDIYVLQKKKRGYILKGRENECSFPTFSRLWKQLSPLCRDKTFIVQEMIALDTIEQRPYDFRVLAHYIGNRWTITGIGARQAKKGAITTHVPHGGVILAAEQVLTAQELAKITMLITTAGNCLLNYYGNVYEFSADIGKSKQGQFYIFEANAKPMSFDEKHIQQKAIDHLCLILRSLSYNRKHFVHTIDKGGALMEKDKIAQDEQHNGRDKYFVDVDRMINEGLAGGTINLEDGRHQIGEATELTAEDPPKKGE